MARTRKLNNIRGGGSILSILRRQSPRISPKRFHPDPLSTDLYDAELQLPGTNEDISKNRVVFYDEQIPENLQEIILKDILISNTCLNAEYWSRDTLIESETIANVESFTQTSEESVESLFNTLETTPEPESGSPPTTPPQGNIDERYEQLINKINDAIQALLILI